MLELTSVAIGQERLWAVDGDSSGAARPGTRHGSDPLAECGQRR